MHYKEDIRSVLFVIITITLLVFPVFYSDHWNLIIKVSWFILTTLFCWSACVINHNHIHRKIFRTQFANNLINILLTIAKGHTASTVIVPHNLNHHVHNSTKEDWAGPHLVRQYSGTFSIAAYLFLSSRSMSSNRRKMAPSLKPEQLRIYRVEILILALFISTILIINPIASVIFVFVPWILGMIILLASNLFQHDGCNIHSKYNHSRNFVSKPLNWFIFNNGYHTIHHMNPKTHWTELPNLHQEKVSQYIHSEFDQKSFLSFIYRYYISKDIKQMLSLFNKVASSFHRTKEQNIK